MIISTHLENCLGQLQKGRMKFDCHGPEDGPNTVFPFTAKPTLATKKVLILDLEGCL